MFLIWCYFDVMGANSRLNSGRVIKPFDIVQIRDIKSCNMVVGGEGEVRKPSVLGNVGTKKCK
jgi:hypothetical protein